VRCSLGEWVVCFRSRVAFDALTDWRDAHSSSPEAVLRRRALEPFVQPRLASDQ
jgi:hypothetical protein